MHGVLAKPRLVGQCRATVPTKARSRRPDEQRPEPARRTSTSELTTQKSRRRGADAAARRPTRRRRQRPAVAAAPAAATPPSTTPALGHRNSAGARRSGRRSSRTSRRAAGDDVHRQPPLRPQRPRQRLPRRVRRLRPRLRLLPAAPAVVAAPPKPVTVPYTRRLYVVRGVTRKGRHGSGLEPRRCRSCRWRRRRRLFARGPAETAVTVELGAGRHRASRSTSTAATIQLQPAESGAAESRPVRAGGRRVRPGAVLPGAHASSLVRQSSRASRRRPQCVTPRDQFAPAAPERAGGRADAGAISLIWDAEHRDGSRRLPGAARRGRRRTRWQRFTAQPIKETSYRDTTVKPGVRYVYAVVAVDTATPPNIEPAVGPGRGHGAMIGRSAGRWPSAKPSDPVAAGRDSTRTRRTSYLHAR